MANIVDLYKAKTPLLAADKFNPTWRIQDQERYIVHRMARLIAIPVYKAWAVGHKDVQNRNTKRRDHEYLGSKSGEIFDIHTVKWGEEKSRQWKKDLQRIWKGYLSCDKIDGLLELMHASPALLRRTREVCFNGKILQASSMQEWVVVQNVLLLLRIRNMHSVDMSIAYENMWNEYLQPGAAVREAAQAKVENAHLKGKYVQPSQKAVPIPKAL